MSGFSITYEADIPPGARVLVPGGMSSPHAIATGVYHDGSLIETVTEENTGQTALVVEGRGERLSLRFNFDDAQGTDYPEAMFRLHASRHTRTARSLIDEVSGIAPDEGDASRALAIARATALRFTYGHPETRFTDGHDQIPALGCGLTEGSCVDINTYFIASLRAAGIETGYVTGYYFPDEKGDWCEDGHCWIVTRTEAGLQEWDIAHHLKMGTRDIEPGLNPKPGFRAASFHSMGLTFPTLELSDLKSLIEPIALTETGIVRFAVPRIRLHRDAMAAMSKTPARGAL